MVDDGVEGAIVGKALYEKRFTLREALEGSDEVINVDGKRLSLRVPAGTRDGARLRLAGQGPGGGDVLLTIRVLEDANFELEGDDLTTTVDVPAPVAALGGEVAGDRAGGLELVGVDLRQTDVPDLALVAERGQLTDLVLQRHVRVDAVEIVQVDPFDAEPLKAALDMPPQRFRAAVAVDAFCRQVVDDQPAQEAATAVITRVRALLEG